MPHWEHTPGLCQGPWPVMEQSPAWHEHSVRVTLRGRQHWGALHRATRISDAHLHPESSTVSSPSPTIAAPGAACPPEPSQGVMITDSASPSGGCWPHLALSALKSVSSGQGMTLCLLTNRDSTPGTGLLPEKGGSGCPASSQAPRQHSRVNTDPCEGKLVPSIYSQLKNDQTLANQNLG